MPVRLALLLTGNPCRQQKETEYSGGHVADEDRSGQQIGEKAEPGRRAQQAKNADQQSERRREYGVAGGVARGKRCDRRPIISAAVDSGPTDIWCDEPNTV